MSNDPDYLAWRERKLAEVHLRGMITISSEVSDDDREQLNRAFAGFARFDRGGGAMPTAQPE